LWSYDGTLDCIHHALYVACREQGEREASPTAAIVDSQSVKRGACIDPYGYDGGKKVEGKKRHILVDTLGLLLHAIVHPANVHAMAASYFLRPCSEYILSGKSSLPMVATRAGLSKRLGENLAST
jgi:Transposase DDE domain